MKNYKIVLLILAVLFQNMFSIRADESASAWLKRMAHSLALNSDFSAQLEIGLLKTEPSLITKNKGQPTVSPIFLHFLRQKDNKAFILITARPSLLSGISFFCHNAQLLAYNPACLCWQNITEMLFFQRTGFFPYELNPLELLSLKPVRDKVTLLKDSRTAPSCVAIELIPSTPIPKVKSLRLLLRINDALPLSLDYLSEEGLALRQVFFSSFYQSKNLYWPQTIVIYLLASAPLTLTFSDPNFEALPEFVFSKSYIEEITH